MYEGQPLLPAPGASTAKTKQLTRGEKNIRWIQRHCRVPEGLNVGEKVELRPWQKQEVLRIYDNPHTTRRAILSFGRKNGKGLDLDTPVLTSLGWRKMRDIREGDRVFGSNGKPVKVTYVSPIHVGLRCWKLTFSDGSEIVADEQHQWLTTHHWRPWEGWQGRAKTAVVTTPQIAESVKHKFKRGGYNHSISCAPPIEMEEKFLPVDPYLLGVWLGDGGTSNSRIASGDQDVEYMAQAVGDAAGSRPFVKKGHTCWSIRAGGLQSSLRKLGVLGNKHIPQDYLEASVSQRWALLQGLMDTDGSISKNKGWTTRQCGFCSTREILADQVWQLARSLGLKAKKLTQEAALTRKDGTKQVTGLRHTIYFTAKKSEPVFRMPRKQDLLPEEIHQRSRTVKIIKCEEVKSVPTVCIQVDAADSLFLAGQGCVPTHNTAFAAFLLLLHLCGLEAKRNSQLYSAAQSRDQAAILFGLAAKIVRMSPALSEFVAVRDTAKELLCKELGTRYKALSAEASTAYGLAPAFIVHDELGQVRGPRFELYEALETATATQESPLSLIISTQAPTDADLLSVLVDDATGGSDPRVVVSLYSADPQLDPFCEETIRLANPAFGDFQNAEEVLAMAEDARRMPSRESEYRNLILNQRVEAFSPFVSRNLWDSCSDPPGDLSKVPCYGGLDLSETQDLTALVLVGKVGGKWAVEPTFWLPRDTIYDRARLDRLPYDLWHQQGYLQAAPGRSVSYEYVAEYLFRKVQSYDVRKVAFDRWNFVHLKPWLLRAGFTEDQVEAKFVEFGQGFKDMSPALRALEVEILEGRIAHGGHPVLKMCAANAVVSSDPTGSRKLAKNRSSGRIDGMVALTMAMGSVPHEDPKEEKKFTMFVVG